MEPGLGCAARRDKSFLPHFSTGLPSSGNRSHFVSGRYSVWNGQSDPSIAEEYFQILRLQPGSHRDGFINRSEMLRFVLARGPFARIREKLSRSEISQKI
jgi:hypothetical protein